MLAQGRNRGADYSEAATAAVLATQRASDAVGADGTSGSQGPAAFALNSAPRRGPVSDTSHGLPPDVARIVDATRQLFEIRTMPEHFRLAQSSLAPDVVWQAPIISTDNRHSLRAAVYVAKSIAHLTLDPHYVEVVPLGGRTLLLLDATVTVMPKRSWLLPPTLLLPDIPIRATIKLGVRGPLDSGKIELIDGRWHNLPRFPALVCNVNGLLMGSLLAATEGLWGRLLPLVGDGPADVGYAREVLGVEAETVGGGSAKKLR